MYLLMILLLSVSVLNINSASKDYNIFFVNDKENAVASEAVQDAIAFLEDKLGVSPNVTEISAKKNDSVLLLNRLCAEYEAALNSSRPPILIFDTTVQGSISEAVKYFTSALALPTISSSFGPIQSRNNTNENNKKISIHFAHPAYLISNLLKSLIWKQGIKDIVVFYDDNFEMRVRFKIQYIVQINETNLSRNDFRNYIIFGGLINIRSTLEIARKHSLLSNIYKWYAVTLDGGEFECYDNCRNFKMILINPFRQDIKEETQFLSII
ncbi:hypothetical protein WA026_015656 [Henosepilachna vigintioctopunctata]|uniref:Receptor ligand binding region domain-containing protein n=1 Tax=Henosepilachna vigintioctopunctata TaxID=420089 RepID=A0AAW1VDR4_9CUCU